MDYQLNRLNTIAKAIPSAFKQFPIQTRQLWEEERNECIIFLFLIFLSTLIQLLCKEAKDASHVYLAILPSLFIVSAIVVIRRGGPVVGTVVAWWIITTTVWLCLYVTIIHCVIYQ
jgi:hypothetical protein